MTYKKPDKEAQKKIEKELFSYIWAALVTLIVLKTAVLYFGAESVLDEQSNYKYLFYVTMLFAVGNLIYFAWKRRKHVD